MVNRWATPNFCVENFPYLGAEAGQSFEYQSLNHLLRRLRNITCDVRIISGIVHCFATKKQRYSPASCRRLRTRATWPLKSTTCTCLPLPSNTLARTPLAASPPRWTLVLEDVRHRMRKPLAVCGILRIDLQIATDRKCLPLYQVLWPGRSRKSKLDYIFSTGRRAKCHCADRNRA